jgi:hypothetical protein
MRLVRYAGVPLVSVILGGLVMVGPAMGAPMQPDDASADARDSRLVQLHPIGTPTWRPVGFQLFSAPIGTGASGYAEFGETILKVLPRPNHAPHPDLGVGPGVAHPPPYDHEIADGVDTQRYRERGPFTLPEFSAGNGVWLAWMNVPDPGTRGSSPDFVSGPVIPNELFPIHVSGFSTHHGERYSTLTDFDVPPLDAVNPPFAVDGHSHFPVFIADNTDFGPADSNPLGVYIWRLEMVDQQGAGWRIEARFVVRR